jgi:hypothetical protein
MKVPALRDVQLTDSIKFRLPIFERPQGSRRVFDPTSKHLEEVVVAKSVSLRMGRTFATVTAAKECFARILSGRELR